MIIRVRCESEVGFEIGDAVADIDEESMPLYPVATGRGVDTACEEKYVLEEDVIKDKTSIVSVVVEKRADVNEKVEDMELGDVKLEDEAVGLAEAAEEVIDMAAGPKGAGGVTPFFGPLPGPATGDAEASTTGPAG